MTYLVQFFAWLMSWCHTWCPNWWADIVIFTFFTKILQFPVSLWCQVNSLKMVSLMPEEIRIRLNHFGDKDAIGEETAAMYMREHYHPLLSLVPLAINIVILMAFVKVIYGIGDKLTVPGMAKPLIACVPVSDGGLAWAMPLLAGAAAWLLGYSQNILNPLQHEQTRVQQLTTNGISIAISLFLGMFVAAGVGLYWATSNLFSILVQVCENICIPPKKHVNYPVLRRAQAELAKFEAAVRANEKKVSKEDKLREKNDYRRFFKVANKHLVFYAEGGGYYKYFQSTIEWLLAHSNVTIHYVTNDPGDKIFDLAGQRSQVKGQTEDDKFHCLTSDLSPLTSRIRPYYIGPTRIIPLMMKMDADIVVMTTPDLNTYQIKRSYVKKDVEYIYLDHGPTSVHMCYRKGAFDHFDTIMCNGPFQVAEHRATEKLYHLKAKNLVESGYPLLDTLDVGQRSKVKGQTEDDKFHCLTSDLSPLTSPPTSPLSRQPSREARIMLANSHQKDNIFDSCLDELITSISSLTSDLGPLTLVLRPHPQYVRRFPARWQAIKEKYSGQRSQVKGQTKDDKFHCLTSDLSPHPSPPTSDLGPLTLIIEDDFSQPSTMDQSDVLITDWSGIAYEFAYKTRRPTLFINTPMKVINPEWQKVGITPTDIWFRDEVGISIDLDKVVGPRSKVKGQTEDDKFHCLTSDLSPLTSPVASAIANMLSHPDTFAAKIDKLFAENFFNLGNAGEAIGSYIINSLINKKKK